MSKRQIVMVDMEVEEEARGTPIRGFSPVSTTTPTPSMDGDETSLDARQMSPDVSPMSSPKSSPKMFSHNRLILQSRRIDRTTIVDAFSKDWKWWNIVWEWDGVGIDKCAQKGQIHSYGFASHHMDLHVT